MHVPCWQVLFTVNSIIFKFSISLFVTRSAGPISSVMKGLRFNLVFGVRVLKYLAQQSAIMTGT